MKLASAIFSGKILHIVEVYRWRIELYKVFKGKRGTGLKHSSVEIPQKFIVVISVFLQIKF